MYSVTTRDNPRYLGDQDQGTPWWQSSLQLMAVLATVTDYGKAGRSESCSGANTGCLGELD